MRTLAAVVLVFFLVVPSGSLFSMEAITSGSRTPPGGTLFIPSVSGGPDEYGYTWIDSNDPGGPTLQWVDITGVGTPVEGLADDNSVGPFPIGFEFPYYWYRADSLYIGSNGWISFSSGQNYAHPFPEQPTASLPNDLLACLSGDIDFTKGGTCLTYTSPGQDSLVVSYLAVPEFNGGDTRHTFQIILTRADSTITFQYGEQVGDFSLGGSNAFSMGIENVTGTIGLSFFHNDNTEPAPDPPPFADSTVIQFIPPESTTYVIHDVGIENALTTGGKGVFIDPAFSLPLWSDLKNFGNQVENLYGASCVIRDAEGDVVYSDTVIGSAPVAPSEIVNFPFGEPFLPGAAGRFAASFGAHLPPGDDMVPENDELLVDLVAFRYPGELAYDDGLEDQEVTWSGDFSGFGNEFVPPYYPAVVEYAKVNVSFTAPGDLVVYVYDDDGLGGGPGTILAGDTLLVSSAGWKTVDFSEAGIVIEDGGFFVGAIARFQSTLGFRLDNNTPLSRRGWEYTAGWAPSRHLSESDIMIRAGVNFQLDTIEDAKLDGNGDFVPDLLGTEVFVTGIITGAAEHFGPDTQPIFFQDETGGVGFVSTEDDTLPDRTEIIVKATVGQTDGLTVLENFTMLQVVRYGAPLPPAVDLMAADLADSAGEAFECLLARLSRVRIVPESFYPAEGEDGSILVMDEEGDTALVFIDKDTDIDGTTTPHDTLLVIRGVVSQSTQSVPPDDGYMLMPRELADIEFATGVEGEEENIPLPVAYSLSQNYPNPFNPETTVSFDIPEGAPEGTRVMLAIYSLRGKFVCTLLDGEKAPGSYRVTWNGRDESGREVTSGVYLIRMEVGGEEFVRKIVLLR
jgi:hypothetical protein